LSSSWLRGEGTFIKACSSRRRNARCWESALSERSGREVSAYEVEHRQLKQRDRFFVEAVRIDVEMPQVGAARAARVDQPIAHQRVHVVASQEHRVLEEMDDRRMRGVRVREGHHHSFRCPLEGLGREGTIEQLAQRGEGALEDGGAEIVLAREVIVEARHADFRLARNGLKRRGAEAAAGEAGLGDVEDLLPKVRRTRARRWGLALGLLERGPGHGRYLLGRDRDGPEFSIGQL
jgi:hypothetical protein